MADKPLYLPDELPDYPGRDGTKAGAGRAARRAIEQSLLMQKRNRLAPPTKRSINGVDGEQAEAEHGAYGPMFDVVEE